MDAYLQIATAINAEINLILHRALSGTDLTLRTPDGFVRWGLVERLINEAVVRHLTED